LYAFSWAFSIQAPTSIHQQQYLPSQFTESQQAALHEMAQEYMKKKGPVELHMSRKQTKTTYWILG